MGAGRHEIKIKYCYDWSESQSRILDPEAKLQHETWSLKQLFLIKNQSWHGKLHWLFESLDSKHWGSLSSCKQHVWPVLAFEIHMAWGFGGEGSGRPSAHAGRPTISQEGRAHYTRGNTNQPQEWSVPWFQGESAIWVCVVGPNDPGWSPTRVLQNTCEP